MHQLANLHFTEKSLHAVLTHQGDRHASFFDGNMQWMCQSPLQSQR
jgi:hypothetical protein